ncbi:enoyl-CoA hydratase [Actinomadura sp. KC345]|uniref:enoyl-CoA hydratase n=1 Tax=Actinomadura sp. KC345 TaxID=2530371 RepID=UPI00104D9AF9|nr:enoyl-CoA hydratase [Actinomadura sp. KC345]TDC55618.1 enoyl-CoA hydratase [Actinomadura sp. KC345]
MAEHRSWTRVRYESPAPGVARVTLARPDVRNAQDKRLLYELNQALDQATQDDSVAVIVLAADGPHFSAGHDLHDDEEMSRFEPVGCWGGFAQPGAEGLVSMEEELFLGLCWRWRNLCKPTVAQVQGKAIAGGLMLVWACDLIVAEEGASFSDPVVAFGVNGHEYFVHAWELGARRAKKLLFTGDAIGAQEAYELGMVGWIVPGDRLEARTLEVARSIAERPGFGLKLAKQAVNQSLDAQGQWEAVQAAYSLHALGHANNMVRYGSPLHPDGAGMIRRQSAGAPEGAP